ncbi:MAG: hypothetical protein IJS20_05855 [Bacteroidales bacterium]|nr:hypothetical protein [Bacteroidales bacterium]
MKDVLKYDETGKTVLGVTGRRSMIAQQKETGCDGYCDECGSIDYSVVECRLTFNP